MTNSSASDIAALRIREARKRRGWTVKDLADRCRKAGAARLTAPVITNLETRRRPGREISAEELLALAWVLEVPPLLLLAPLNDSEALQVVPGEEKGPLDAPEWLADDHSVRTAVRAAASGRPQDTEWALRYRDDPLTVIRQVSIIADRIGQWERSLTDPAWHAARYIDDDRAEAAIRVYGTRLLHLLASLAALGYSPPPLEDVMAILARHGIPGTLAEWQDDQEEEPDVEMP